MSIPLPREIRKSRHRAIPLRMRLATAALVASAGMASTAYATVVTFNTPISVPSTFAGIYVNLLTGANATTPGAVVGWDFDPFNSSPSLSFFWNGIPASSNGGVAGTANGPYLDLPFGSTVSSASTFSAVTAASQSTAFQSVGIHRLGFRFFNEVTAAVNYGVITLSVAGPTGFPLTITGWSFENSGAPFTLTDVTFSNGFE